MEEDRQKKINLRYAIAALITLVFIAIPTVYTLVWLGIFEDKPLVTIMPPDKYPKTLHVVADYNFEPYSYVEFDGRYSGYDVELINELGNRLGMNVDLKMLEWSEAVHCLEAGTADILLGRDFNEPSDIDKTIRSIPLITDKMMFFGKKNINSISDLRGKRIECLDGDAWSIENFSKSSNWKIKRQPCYNDLFRDLERGECDYVLCYQRVGSSITRKLDYHDIKPVWIYGDSHFGLELAGQDKELVEKINRAIYSMDEDGTLTKLSKKWLEVDKYSLENVIYLHKDVYFMFVIALLLWIFAIVFFVFYEKNVEKNRALSLEYEKNLEGLNEELRSMLAAVKEAYKSADLANTTKTEFLSNMSHDIRTPMNVLLGMVTVAKNHIDDKERVKECLEEITESGNQLLLVISEIMDMSRIMKDMESSDDNIGGEEFDLVEFTDFIVDMAKNDAEAHHHEMTFNIDNMDKEMVVGDSMRLQQVFSHLLDNAVNYTPDGGKIEVRLSKKESEQKKIGYYEFVIKDNGIGISEEMQKKIFEPFIYGNEVVLPGEIKRTGLGLAIARNIVRMMGGDIKVDSELNKGSEFAVSFYLLKNEKYIEEDDGDKKEEIDITTLDLSGKRALVVDDNEISAEIIGEILSMVGMEIDYAEDGLIALEKLQKCDDGHYDIVFMDIEMPNLDGHKATKTIRKLKREYLKNIPIVAVTANAMLEDVNLSKDSGMDDHIAKPLDMQDLSRILCEYVLK